MTEFPAAVHLPSRTSPENATPDFNRLAGVYRWLEYLTFGPFLWQCRVRFLPQLVGCRHALILGDGDGRFTARLLREYPQIQVHAVDASPRMIEALKQACKHNAARLRTEVADLRNWRPAISASNSANYDLIVTHFFLDCLSTDEVAALASSLDVFADSGALWLISDFAIPPTIFGRTIAAPLVGVLYRAFGWITGLRQQSLPDHPGALRAAGWSIRNRDTSLFGLLQSQLWQRGPAQSESREAADSST